MRSVDDLREICRKTFHQRTGTGILWSVDRRFRYKQGLVAAMQASRPAFNKRRSGRSLKGHLISHVKMAPLFSSVLGSGSLCDFFFIPNKWLSPLDLFSSSDIHGTRLLSENISIWNGCQILACGLTLPKSHLWKSTDWYPYGP